MNFEKIIPADFKEMLSAVMFIFAVLFSLISLSKSQREHSIRIVGLFLLSCLALFAHHWGTYFASVFIVATAVTQLEFLQNLAAIIRGSKEYFEYQKEFLTSKEVKNKIEKETEQIEAATLESKENQSEIADSQSQKVISLTVDQTNLTAYQFFLLVEDYTFRFLEKQYGKPLQKYVRFKGKNSRAEFDGVLQLDSSTDLVFEIKASRNSFFPLKFMKDSMESAIKKAIEYQEITKRIPILRYIIVGNYSTSYITKLVQVRDEILANESAINFMYEIYTFEEIGLSNLQTENLDSVNAEKSVKSN